MTTLPYGATLKKINAKEKYEHLPGVTHCSLHDCWAVLGEIAYDLHIPGQERDGVHYWGYGAHFCSEEHALQWLEAEYPQRQFSCPTITDSIPTQETRDVWIHSFRKMGDYPEDTDRSGKWLIWLKAENIDRYWSKIADAVKDGQLGSEAKVSTAASRAVRQGRPYVICVYTYDYDDKSDVMRIREELHKLGIRREIIYKADEDTQALRYGSNYTPKYRE